MSATFEPGTAFEDDAFVGDPLDQIGVLDGPYAMADAAGADVVERARHAFPAGEFASMDGYAEAGLARDFERPHVILNIAEALFAGHAEAGDQRVTAFRGEARGGLHRLHAEMTHPGNDHAPLDAGLVARPDNPLAQGIRIGFR